VTEATLLRRREAGGKTGQALMRRLYCLLIRGTR